MHELWRGNQCLWLFILQIALNVCPLEKLPATKSRQELQGSIFKGIAFAWCLAYCSRQKIRLRVDEVYWARLSWVIRWSCEFLRLFTLSSLAVLSIGDSKAGWEACKSHCSPQRVWRWQRKASFCNRYKVWTSRSFLVWAVSRWIRHFQHSCKRRSSIALLTPRASSLWNLATV